MSQAVERDGGSATLSEPAPRPLLVFRDVSAGYGGTDILHEVSFEGPKGAHVRGRSGVVLENGRVRLEGWGREVLEHPEIGALFLGGEAPLNVGPSSGNDDA